MQFFFCKIELQRPEYRYFLQLSKSIRSTPFLFTLYLDIFIDIVVFFLALHSVDRGIKSLDLHHEKL